MSVFDTPRYKETPIKLFFENYVLHVLRLLPEDVSEQIQKLNLKEMMGTKSSNWYDAVPEILKLSKTMEVAIWDVWIANKDKYIAAQKDFRQFALDFTDRYMSPNSPIDVWTEESYKAAAQRVNTYIQKISS